MKVKLNFNQESYSGQLDDLVYYWDPRLKMMIARRKPLRQVVSPSQHHLGAISRNLSSLISNPDYKAELRIYLDLLEMNGLAEGCTRWFGLYTRLMWKLAEKYPELDLEILSSEEAGTYSCRSVKSAVEDGLLPAVEGYQRLDSLICDL